MSEREPVVIRSMNLEEAGAVSRLVMESFDAYVAPGYSLEGIRVFSEFATEQAIKSRDTHGFTYVAELGGQLAGVIQVQQPSHVLLLFVRPTFFRRGIARQLMDWAVQEIHRSAVDVDSITVNSSLYAVPAYERLGFRVSGEERNDNGVLCMPMTRTISRG